MGNGHINDSSSKYRVNNFTHQPKPSKTPANRHTPINGAQN